MNAKPTYYKGFTISIRTESNVRYVTITEPHTGQSHALELQSMGDHDFHTLNFAKEYADVVLLNNNV